jgi:dolichol-phosphate mannosyltransferase
LLSFSPVPARAAAVCGVALAGVSWVVSFAAVLMLAPLAESTTKLILVLLSALHLLAGGLFAATGVVGEYLFRIYDQSKNRPVYVLKEASRDAAEKPAALRPPRAA